MSCTRPQCPSCASNIPRTYYVARLLKVEPDCDHHVVTYPSATSCPYYRREPGAD
jgi:hypothetical protein